MELGRVIGTVTCTIKDPGLQGIRLVLVLPVDQSQMVAGKPFVAADAISAAPGSLIYYETAREAPFAFPHEPPIDAAIVGLAEAVGGAVDLAP